MLAEGFGRDRWCSRSLRAPCDADVMVMSRLRRLPVRLAIAPAAGVCVAGEPITVRVTAAGHHEVSIRAARAGMIARIWYRRPEVTGLYVVGGPVTRPIPPPATVTGAAASLGLPATLPAGGTVEREAVVPNWACAPSGALGVLRVEYRLRARLVLGDGRTVSDAVPVRLESRRSLNQDVEGAPLAYRQQDVEFWRHDPVRYRGDCDLRLRLPVRHARPGEILRGVLQVSPHDPVAVRRVLVSLQLVEALAGPAVPSVVSDAEYRGEVESPVTKARRVKAVALAGRTRLTGPRDFPFASGCPAAPARRS